MLIQCAFNFPGVLCTLGVNYWESLRKLFFDLIKHQNKVNP